MSSEKSDAIVIRLVDFSESSQVVTLFTRDFGKIGCLAKGSKRLKSAFENALDLLAECTVVFIHKSTAGLDLLTEAKLRKRFRPAPTSLIHLYGGYYIAELLNLLTEDADPHPELYDAAILALEAFCTTAAPHAAIFRFELIALQEIGQLPDLETCTICQSTVNLDEHSRFWVSASGLICSKCGHSEYEQTEIRSGAIAIARQLLEEDGSIVNDISITEAQRRDLRRLLTSAISAVLGRRPKTLKYLGS